jgi:hypothetical protein
VARNLDRISRLFHLLPARIRKFTFALSQLRLFESLVDRKVPDGSDLLQLILSACKFLDLTLVLQTEDFQMCVLFAYR